MNEEKIAKILNSLLKGTHFVEESTFNNENFYIAGYKFLIGHLLEDEVDFLKTALTGEVRDSCFLYWVADTNQKPVLFDKKEDAKLTIEKEMRFLEKRFLFATYNETGIIYKKPESANVTFFKKKKKGK